MASNATRQRQRERVTIHEIAAQMITIKSRHQHHEQQCIQTRLQKPAIQGERAVTLKGYRGQRLARRNLHVGQKRDPENREQRQYEGQGEIKTKQSPTEHPPAAQLDRPGLVGFSRNDLIAMALL